MANGERGISHPDCTGCSPPLREEAGQPLQTSFPGGEPGPGRLVWSQGFSAA